MSLSNEEKTEIKKLINEEVRRIIKNAYQQFTSHYRQEFFKNKKPEDISQMVIKMIEEGIDQSSIP